MENKYDNIIPGISDPVNKPALRQEYIKAYLTVISRCFGWGLPCTTLIPFADCINHHNVDSGYEFIKKEWKPISIEQYHERFDQNKTIVTPEKQLSESVEIEDEKVMEKVAPEDDRHYNTKEKCCINYELFYDLAKS